MHALIPRRPWLPTLLLCVLALAAPSLLSAAPASSTPAAHGASETATRAKLAAVRAQIAKIAATQHATAARRAAINAQLATQARQLEQAAKAVAASDAAIAKQTAALASLTQQRTQLEANLNHQRAALADLLRASYTLNRGSDLSLLLGNGDIAKLNRALAYSRYFQQDRVTRIHSLLDQLAKLDQVKAAIEQTTATLQQQRAQRAAQQASLEQARSTQRKLLAQADTQLAQQKNKLAALQQRATALDALLKRLQNVFADIPTQLGKTTPFAQLRGKLPWPVAGRPKPGAGALAHGLVIAAKPGASVHAVAYGRVAWADFMRGFGILVIIDHGDGWMSLYGGNEAATVEVGEWVQPGQPIAIVGRDSEQGGAWFGLRHDGKPVDPGGWLAKRKQ